MWPFKDKKEEPPRGKTVKCGMCDSSLIVDTEVQWTRFLCRGPIEFVEVYNSLFQKKHAYVCEKHAINKIKAFMRKNDFDKISDGWRATWTVE